MWRQWKPAIVRKDLRCLRKTGVQVIRVFPIWPDFQPIAFLRSGQEGGEMRHGEDPMPFDEDGKAGVSPVMMDRFRALLDMAAEQDIGCIVGIITGWMSGRLFLPPALSSTNPITDPTAIRWTLRFVKRFVTAFREHPALLAWDLGNECNCMGRATADEAYAWTAAVSYAIRASDPAHPVISGMHSLAIEGCWTISDQAELTDMLTTHPYPIFTPHCGKDALNSIRPILHSAAESRFYADVGGSPCLCEEIGNLGPMFASEKIAAEYFRAALFSLWANGVRGALWWCAFDQDRLSHAPYDWCSIERELGLFRSDGSPKPVASELSAFGRFLDSLPFNPLPPRMREAVCILSPGQDHWAAAYGSFILAKQAGFDIEFQYSEQPLKDSELYLLPCLSGLRSVSRKRMKDLLARIRAGATLYISLNDATPSEFESITGLEPQFREARTDTRPASIRCGKDSIEIPTVSSHRIVFRATRATVLGREADGNPVFSAAEYGKGKVWLFSLPLETMVATTAGALRAGPLSDGWRIYRLVASPFIAKARAVLKTEPALGVTEHPLCANRRVIVAVNMSPSRLECECVAAPHWLPCRVHRGLAAGRGSTVAIRLEPCDAAVFEMRRA